MTLQELQNRKVEVKVLDNPTEDTKALIGKVLEVRAIYYYDKRMGVWDEDKRYYHMLNISDVQFMTPLSYNGVQIGIGDTVNGGIVYGFNWINGKYFLETVRNNNFEDSYCGISETYFKSHTPLYKENKQSDKELIAEMEKRGLLVDGKCFERVI
ncbi:MAG: hypothetical protein ACTSQE_12655 [Candidatus Heimdallarchaeaceae archaeon]